MWATGQGLAGLAPSLGSALPGFGHSQPPVIQAKGFPQSTELAEGARSAPEPVWVCRSAVRSTTLFKKPTKELPPQQNPEQTNTNMQPTNRPTQVHRLTKTGLFV